jgi:hypothetical protein
MIQKQVNRKELFLRSLTRYLVKSSAAGLLGWLVWVIGAGLYWLLWEPAAVGFDCPSLLDGYLPWLPLVTFASCLLYDYQRSLHVRVTENEAWVVKRLSPRGIHYEETLYWGNHQLPVGAWISSRIPLRSLTETTNEMLVWLAEHPVRVFAQVQLHVTDPAAFDRTDIDVQAVYQRAFAAEFFRCTREELQADPRRLNTAVLEAINAEFLAYGLCATRFELQRVTWVHTGQQWNFPAARYAAAVAPLPYFGGRP